MSVNDIYETVVLRVLPVRSYWFNADTGARDTLPRWRLQLLCGHAVLTVPAPGPPKVGSHLSCSRCKAFDLEKHPCTT